MSWFHFCTANHTQTGRATLGDMAAWFEAGLLDLGHKVTSSDRQVERGAVNLFWEAFTARSSAEIAGLGVTYGIIATEIPDGEGFNWRREQPWIARYQAFDAAARKASFIWTMIESTVPFYSRFCPTAYVPFGFSERLVPAPSSEPPVFDFSFFGLRTPYREGIVAKLRSARLKVEWPERFLSAFEVERLIGHSKIGLSFKQSEQWPIPSPTRLGRLMHAKRAVAAEHVSVATRQGEIAGVCPPDIDFADYAIGMLADGWQQRAITTFERYRAGMPMGPLMQAVLDDTLAGPAADGSRDTIPKDSAVEIVREPEAPTVLGVVGDYNIVSYADRYVAVSHDDGLVDFAGASIDAYPLQSTDRDDLEHRVRELACLPRLVSTIGDHNVVRLGSVFVGVPRALGAIDLAAHTLDGFKIKGTSRDNVEAQIRALDTKPLALRSGLAKFLFD